MRLDDLLSLLGAAPMPKEVLSDGSRVEKCWAESEDETPRGATGTIRCALRAGDHVVAYVVNWDRDPKTDVVVAANKVVACDATRGTAWKTKNKSSI